MNWSSIRATPGARTVHTEPPPCRGERWNRSDTGSPVSLLLRPHHGPRGREIIVLGNPRNRAAAVEGQQGLFHGTPLYVDPTPTAGTHHPGRDGHVLESRRPDGSTETNKRDIVHVHRQSTRKRKVTPKTKWKSELPLSYPNGRCSSGSLTRNPTALAMRLFG